MDTFRQHELFEIEVLDRMRSFKLLDPLVFGGGTMLRLCHELNRYSADLDFWFVRPTSQSEYFNAFKQLMEKEYEITDAQIKHYTLLLELRTGSYPKRLKIEIRREMKALDFQTKIAFTQFDSKQILLNALTLEQAMKNKVAAFMDRVEIRDGFDIEFLLRKGVAFPHMNAVTASAFRKKIRSLKDKDFKVKLGLILESDTRKYYITRKFAYLEEKLGTLINI